MLFFQNIDTNGESIVEALESIGIDNEVPEEPKNINDEELIINDETDKKLDVSEEVIYITCYVF